jgi:hypothetical protein
MKSYAVPALGLCLLLAFCNPFGGSTALERADPEGGPLVTSKPLQISAKTMGYIPPDREINGYKIKHQARFELDALVLHKRNYRWGKEADISPTDLALGWGVMSDPAFLENVKISQKGRFFYWKTKERGMNGQVIFNSSNMHIIPDNEDIAKKLKDVQEGDLVQLNGYLVNVKGGSGWRWNTSLNRSDTGAGACEIFLVESLEIE